MDYEAKLKKIRSDFPILTKRIRGKNLVYLDSAATAIKPWQVIERISHFYAYETANVHRGAHFLADQATSFFELTRDKVKDFINAASNTEIIFTKGTTESINLVAQSWGEKFIEPGDEILITEMEHHANIVPWQVLAQKKQAHLIVVRVTDQGEVDFEDFRQKLSSKTAMVAFTHCSNILGTINPAKEMTALAHAAGAKVLIDGAQMVSNSKVDVQDLDADFYCFSGHKLFGPYGVGVLYGKENILNEMPPYQTGGSMISKVSYKGTEYNDLPFKFEAGTPNIEAVIALASAIDYVLDVGFDYIHHHENILLKKATESLSSIAGLKLIGTSQKKAPILSFNIEGLHAADLGQILDQEAIAVRVGHHCAQPLMERYKITSTVGASFSIFNTVAEVDTLTSALNKAVGLLS